MTKQHDTKTTLIKVGMELIRTQGYHATGISAAQKQASVPKGSFYHHFESKEDFYIHFANDITEWAIDSMIPKKCETVESCVACHHA